MGRFETAAQRFLPEKFFPSVDVRRVVWGVSETARAVVKDAKGAVEGIATFLAKKEKDTVLYDRFASFVDEMIEPRDPQARYLQIAAISDPHDNSVHFYRITRKETKIQRGEDRAKITVTTRHGRSESLEFWEEQLSPTRSVMVPMLEVGVKRTDGWKIPCFLTGKPEDRKNLSSVHIRRLNKEELETIYDRLRKIRAGELDEVSTKRELLHKWAKHSGAIIFSAV